MGAILFGYQPKVWGMFVQVSCCELRFEICTSGGVFQSNSRLARKICLLCCGLHCGRCRGYMFGPSPDQPLIGRNIKLAVKLIFSSKWRLIHSLKLPPSRKSAGSELRHVVSSWRYIAHALHSFSVSFDPFQLSALILLCNLQVQI